MARGEDPIEKVADEAIDPGEPRIPPAPPEEGAAVVEPEGVPSEEAEEGGDEELELPEGTVVLYDEEGQPYLAIPIDPEDIPEEGGNE